MFEWLIIGGGIQGCTMATYLVKKKKVLPRNLAIIDPHPSPLTMWKHCTNTIEMPYLRSPSIHHLDPEPFALEKFAKSESGKAYSSFVAPYDRPSLQLFRKHCEYLFSEIKLASSWIQGKVCKLKKFNNYWRVTLENDVTFTSSNVVLAIGLSEQVHWPDWAQSLERQNLNISHIYDGKEVESDPNHSTVIIGGGISAAHTALKLSKQAPGKITLVTNHKLKVNQFDSDPGWLGPKYMNRFSKVSSYDQRRSIINKARHRGTMPPELKTKLINTQKQGKLDIIISKIKEVEAINNQIFISLQSKQMVHSHSLYLATGFKQTAPGYPWLKETIHEEKLPIAACGYPISTSSLKWKEGLYVLGPLSELEIGPVARNIAGARRGAERIIATH